MKIVHISPSSPYNDYWGYQENLLPKYQKKLGHDVTLITTNFSHENGKIVEVETGDYILKDGVRVIRLPVKRFPKRWLSGWHSHLNVLPLLTEIEPDFVFFHGLVSTTIFEVIGYKKKYNPSCVIVQDNHMDYNIGHKVKTVKQKITRSFFRFINMRSVKNISRVYGVTPWRKVYAEDYFKIPSSKTDVLIMGADDEKIDFENRSEIRRRIREEYKINNGDYLIVTGGKIDEKKKVHVLMEAVGKLKGVKLLIFGSVSAEFKESFKKFLNENDNIIYMGWVEAERVYNYFFASDLVVFPGQHSVLWEQAAASKVPAVFRRWEGMEHVNNKGNAAFIDEITASSLAECIESLKFTPEYYEMKKVAESENTNIFLYSKIAERSLEAVEKNS